MTPSRHDQVKTRIAEIDAKLAAATAWGAGLTPLVEERRYLVRERVMIEARAA